MLTIKHLVHTGDESIRQALEVRLAIEPVPSSLQKTSDDTHRAVVYADLEHNSTIQYDGGIVYVMNGEGATVAKYDLNRNKICAPKGG